MAKRINFKKKLSNELYNLLCTAYGDDFSKVEKYLNASGWCRLEHSDFPHINKDFGSIKTWWWRPTALRGFIGCA
jgi:hypothetical protein